MTASRLTSRKSRREGRKKGKGSTTGQAPTIISACLSWISSRSFSLPWWGLTPPRGQAPVDVIHVHVSTLKHTPGIPRRRKMLVRTVKAIRTMPLGEKRMKAYISIDMEGVCGIVREIETDPKKGGDAYQQSRHLMTQEANAAIEGCIKGGATEVLIADSHWNFDNLIPEELHEAATLLRGTPRGLSMMQELDASYDAALFVGYHARAGTPRASLESGSRCEGDLADPSEDTDRNDRRVPRDVRGRSRCNHPDGPPHRRIAIRIRSRRLPASIPHFLRDGDDRR